jgi:hypothetical protein
VVDEYDRQISPVHRSRERFRLDEFFAYSPVKHLLCWRRERGLAVGGMDESLSSVGPDDWDFPWSMAEQGAQFRAIREPLYRYRDHREGYRLTTHVPQDQHEESIARMLRKHGATPRQVEAWRASARRGYLRVCLYRSEEDRARKERQGFDPRSGWRRRYR